MIQIYGIPTCGSVKKAIVWAREAGVEFTFHNFRTEAPTDELLSGWLKDIPAAKLANTAGPTWRKIDPEIREKKLKGWHKAVKYSFDWAKED